MRRLISVGLAAVVFVAAVPVALGLLQGASHSEGEAASATLTCTVKAAPCGVGEVEVFRMSAVANAHAALKLGVTKYDATVAGLGGCPFAGQKGAAGNICTEELVLLCEEMGIDTGIDLDQLIEVGRMAEEIVGHTLPSELIHAGSLNAFRQQAA